MTIRLSTAQASALGRIDKFAQGSPVRTYMPMNADMRTFRSLEQGGWCRYRKREEPDVLYNGYELTDKGRDFLKGRKT